jgi:hypothetical protein
MNASNTVRAIVGFPQPDYSRITGTLSEDGCRIEANTPSKSFAEGARTDNGGAQRTRRRVESMVLATLSP